MSTFTLHAQRSVSGALAACAYVGRLLRWAAAHPVVILGRFAALPGRIAEIRRIVSEAMEPAALDEALWSFHGFHTSWSDPHYRSRTWDRLRMASIGAHDADGMSVEEMVAIMRISMEIEEPIPLYSRQSGEGFRFLLPTLARYMGKNQEQADYAAAHGLPWCESSWCEEEKRHAPAFAHAIEHLTGEPAAACKPNEVAPVTSSERDAIDHLVRRQATEWGSSATYVVLAAHARGDLRRLLLNLALDEIKHLAIIAAADRFLLGPRPWRRLLAIARVMAHYTRHHTDHRSDGATIAGNAVTVLEIATAMALEEGAVRRWAARLPLAALRDVFEVASTLPAIAAFEPRGAEREEVERKTAAEASRRASLSRWSDRERRRAMRKLDVEARHGLVLDRMVGAQLGRFAGAEDAGSSGDREIRRRIRRLPLAAIPADDRAAARTALVERLRHHQIRGNRYERSLAFPFAASLERLDQPERRAAAAPPDPRRQRAGRTAS